MTKTKKAGKAIINFLKNNWKYIVVSWTSISLIIISILFHRLVLFNGFSGVDYILAITAIVFLSISWILVGFELIDKERGFKQFLCFLAPLAFLCIFMKKQSKPEIKEKTIAPEVKK